MPKSSEGDPLISISLKNTNYQCHKCETYRLFALHLFVMSLNSSAYPCKQCAISNE